MEEYEKKIIEKLKSKGICEKPRKNISFLILGNGWWLANVNEDKRESFKNWRKKFFDYMNKKIPKIYKEGFSNAFNYLPNDHDKIIIDFSDVPKNNFFTLGYLGSYDNSFKFSFDTLHNLFNNKGYYVYIHLSFLLFKKIIEDSEENTYFEDWFDKDYLKEDNKWINYVEDFFKFFFPKYLQANSSIYV